MAKPELGTKRTCPECAARFYDLGKMPCVCPKCEHSFEPEILLKSKKRIEDEEPKKEAPEAETESDEEEDSGVEEVTAEGMSRMPEEVDEDGVAISSDDEEDGIEIDGVDLDDDESEDSDDDTLMDFDEGDDDVSAIIDTDIDKLKDDS